MHCMYKIWYCYETKKTKPNDINANNWDEINVKACGLIHSYVSKEHNYSFLQETFINSLWKALENKYMKKSNENRLYLLMILFHL